MKRMLAFVLVAMMVFSLGAAAFAAEENTETWDEMGYTLTYTEEFNDTKGIFMPFPYPAVQDGIYQMIFDYYSFSKEESDAFNEKALNDELTDEDIDKILNSECTLLVVLAIDGGRGPEELLEALALEGSPEDILTEVGAHEDITYYAITDPELYREEVASLPEEYVEEYHTLQDAMVEVLKNAEYFTPVKPGADLIGTVLQFETTDIDGNAVKSEELFAEHEVTMVNIWATWCGPCKSEMPELGELARSLETDGRDAAIVGICDDAAEESDLCHELLEEMKVDYLNLLPFDDMLETLSLSAYPTTLFVNRDGMILLPPIEGVPSDLSQYEQLIDAFLAAAEASGEGSGEPAGAVANDEKAYRVFVTDENGDPVEGAMIQFCDDTACMMEKTDAEGVAVYEVEEGSYTVHVLKAPEGFEAVEEEFPTLDTFCDVFITLPKAA